MGGFFSSHSVVEKNQEFISEMNKNKVSLSIYIIFHGVKIDFCLFSDGKVDSNAVPDQAEGEGAGNSEKPRAVYLDVRVLCCCR